MQGAEQGPPIPKHVLPLRSLRLVIRLRSRGRRGRRVQKIWASRVSGGAQAGHRLRVCGSLRGEGVCEVYVHHACEEGEAGAFGTGLQQAHRAGQLLP